MDHRRVEPDLLGPKPRCDRSTGWCHRHRSSRQRRHRIEAHIVVAGRGRPVRRPAVEPAGSPPLASKAADAVLVRGPPVPTGSGPNPAAVSSFSQPQPMERLQTAPGNWRSTESNSWAIFRSHHHPWTVEPALTSTVLASGPARGSPPGPSSPHRRAVGWPPTTIGVNLGRRDISAKESRSAWSIRRGRRRRRCCPCRCSRPRSAGDVVGLAQRGR